MKNPIKYLFLTGAIFCGAIGMISMLISNEGIWAWIPWLAFIPAFTFLNYVIEDYGIGSAYTLWVGAIVVFVALFVILIGGSWGEYLNNTQYFALLLICLGLGGLGISQPKAE